MLRDGAQSALHALDLDEGRWLDADLWRLAREENYVVVTKDVDFAYLALSNSEGPSVVWLRCGNLALAPFKAWFEARWPRVRALLAEGEHLIEMR